MSSSLSPWQLSLFLIAFSATIIAGILYFDCIEKTFLDFNTIQKSHENELTYLNAHDPPMLFSFYDELEIEPYHSMNNERVYKYFSPYEQRFPQYSRPYWAEKTIPYNRNIPGNRQICFVHVGKAGGSTVGCTLGFSLHCSSDSQTAPGILPVITTHVFHRGVYDCRDDASLFLFVIRDPLERIISAFNYDRPLMTETLPNTQKFRTREFYLDCPFWTMNDVVQKGLLPTDNRYSSEDCRQRADVALKGTEEYITHWYFNYQYYAEFIPWDATILVIRNEHMAEDWNNIERMFGAKFNVLNSSSLPVNNVHDKNSTDLYLSDESRLALCRKLCNEIQVYKNILRKAENLRREQLERSFEELKLQCPIEAINEVCQDDMPDISRKIEERKGC